MTQKNQNQTTNFTPQYITKTDSDGITYAKFKDGYGGYYYQPVKCFCGHSISRSTPFTKSERFNLKTGRYYTVSVKANGGDPWYQCTNEKCYTGNQPTTRSENDF